MNKMDHLKFNPNLETRDFRSQFKPAIEALKTHVISDEEQKKSVFEVLLEKAYE